MTSEKAFSLDVAILCGGKGSRLQPVVSDRPKSMALVRGRPFLEWQLLSLREMGFKNILLCTGYMGWNIREYFGDGEHIGLRIGYSEENEPMGTGGALHYALQFLESDPVLIMNGDSWCDVDVAEMLDFHSLRDSSGTLLLSKVADTQRYGRVEVASNGEVLKFSEKEESKGTAGLVNAGVYLLSQKLLLSTPSTVPVSLEKDIFSQWVGHGLYGCQEGGPFLDIGLPTSYATAETFFAGMEFA